MSGIDINNIARVDILNITKTIPEKSSIVRTTYTQQLYRITQSIDKWRLGLIHAESVINPKRYELIRTYNDIVLDNHLSALMQSRKNKILSKNWGFYNKESQKIANLDKMVDSEWFVKTLDMALDSLFYGYSLIQFGDIVNDSFNDVELVRREYVSPELGLVLSMPTTLDGKSYNDKPYSDWCLFVGQKYDFGLLVKAAPLVIYKKFIMGNWAEFAEVFGMPYKEAHTNVRDPELMANMVKALSQTGSNAYGIFDTDDTIKFIQTSTSDSFQVYNQFIERMNSELSKLIIGQTGTTDMGKNRGSDDVHQNVADEYGKRDEWFLRSFVNGKFIPFLKNLGFSIPDDAVFQTEKESGMNLAELGKLAIELLKVGDIEEGYIEETFGIPFTKKIQQELAVDTLQPSGGSGAKKSQTITDELVELYSFKGHVCNVHPIDNKKDDGFQPPYSDDETENWLQKVYIGIVTIKHLDPILYERYAELLTNAVEKGFGGIGLEFSFGTPDYEMLVALKENVWVFSGAKSFQLTKEVNAMLFDGNGVKRTFAEFKKAVLPVIDDYNLNYLKTEYNTAIASAQQARQWNDIQRDKKTLPLLKYITVGDGRVRVEHKILDGIIKPVGDTFWNKSFPPNGFNCRCTTSSLSEGNITETIINNEVLELNIDEIITPKYFQFNCGKKKMIFSPKHPYFKVGEQYKAFAEMNFNLPLPNQEHTHGN